CGPFEPMARSGHEAVGVAADLVVVGKADHHDRAAAWVAALAQHGHARHELEPLGPLRKPVVPCAGIHSPTSFCRFSCQHPNSHSYSSGTNATPRFAVTANVLLGRVITLGTAGSSERVALPRGQ